MSATHGSEAPEAPSDAPAAWLFEHSHDLFVVLDAELKVVRVNPAWTRVLGWSEAELTGHHPGALIHPDDLEEAMARDEELRRTGTARQEHRLAVKGGGWRWFDGTAHQLADGGRIGVLRDITEEKERAAERRLSVIQAEILAAKVGVVQWTLDARSREFTRNVPPPAHLGYGPRLSFGMETMAPSVHPDDRLRVLAILEHAMATGEAGAYELRVAAPYGGWLVYRANYHCERRDGRWLVHGVSQDVTELVAARDAALTAEAEVRHVLEEAPFASAVLSPDMRYLSASGAWRDLFGMPRGLDCTGLEFGLIQTPAARKRLVRVMKRALAGEVVDRAQDEMITADGSPVILRWQAAPWRTAGGEIRGILVYATDITAVVNGRRAARATARRLKLALEAADASVFEIDYVGKTFWAGPGFPKLAGRVLSFEEALGVWPTIHPDDQPAIAAQVARFDSHNPTPFECRMGQGEEARWIRSHIRIQHDAQGRPHKSVGLIQDIDDSKRQAIALDEAQRRAHIATEAKSNFLANISHEIRTPMNGVLGVLQVIKREHLDVEEQGLLDEALASGRMLSEMLDDLLDFSKIETGQFELHNEALDPTAVLVGVASLLQPAATAKGLTISAVASPDLGFVSADPLRLRQALYNIMGNAVKFTPQGSIEARLARCEGPDGSPRLRFEVQDTGIGVPEAFQATLFERFEQADGSASRKYGGSGLGLAITKRLAEMMGGAVGFTANPGQGSTFWIEIDGAATEATTASGDQELEIGEFRVLLVEDNPTNRLVISKILEALGVTVETAEDGAEGVELAASGRYDLVLMDIQMPGMDGLEATRRIRAMEGPRGLTPIVAVTANVLADQRTRYADAGMDGVVSKPVSAGALLAEISRVTERSAAA